MFLKLQYFSSSVLGSLYLLTFQKKDHLDKKANVTEITEARFFQGSSNNVNPFAPVTSLGPADINLFQDQFQFERSGIFCCTSLCGAFPTPSEGDSQEICDLALSRWAVQSPPHSCAAPQQVSSAHTLVPLASPSSLSKELRYDCVADAPSLRAGLRCHGARSKQATAMDLKPSNDTKPCHRPTK